MLTTNHLVPRLWMSRAIPLLPSRAFIAWRGAHFPITIHGGYCLLGCDTAYTGRIIVVEDGGSRFHGNGGTYHSDYMGLHPTKH